MPVVPEGLRFGDIAAWLSCCCWRICATRLDIACFSQLLLFLVVVVVFFCFCFFHSSDARLDITYREGGPLFFCGWRNVHSSPVCRHSAHGRERLHCAQTCQRELKQSNRWGQEEVFLPWSCALCTGHKPCWRILLLAGGCEPEFGQTENPYSAHETAVATDDDSLDRQWHFTVDGTRMDARGQKTGKTGGGSRWGNRSS
jgi:hypothetical protein